MQVQQADRPFNPTSVASGSSQIYVYRPSQFTASLRSYSVYVDNREVGVLRNGGYLIANVKPGSHIVKVDVSIFPTHDEVKQSVQLKSGEKSFYKLALDASMIVTGVGNIYSSSSELAKIPQMTALQELSALHYSS